MERHCFQRGTDTGGTWCWIFAGSVYSRIPEMPRSVPTKLNFRPFLTLGGKGALELRVGTGSLGGLGMLPSICPLGSSYVLSSGL